MFHTRNRKLKTLEKFDNEPQQYGPQRFFINIGNTNNIAWWV